MENSRRKFLKSVIIGSGGVVSGLPVLGNSYSIGAYKTPSGAISSFIMEPIGVSERATINAISAGVGIPVNILIGARLDSVCHDMNDAQKLEFVREYFGMYSIGPYKVSK